MDKRKFIITILYRHASIGAFFMGVYNVALLFLYFTHRIAALPPLILLLKTDALLLACALLIGIIVELVIRAVLGSWSRKE